MVILQGHIMSMKVEKITLLCLSARGMSRQKKTFMLCQMLR